MRRNQGQKCEECQQAEGVTTGLSGDLLCRSCGDQQIKAARSKQNTSKNQNSGQVMDKSSDKGCVLFDAVMSYISFAMQNSSIENIKQVVLGHFTSSDVISSKDLLWDSCDISVIGEKLKRKGTQVRSEKEANLHDVFSALTKLDKQDKMPKFAVLGTDLNKIPKFNPEEIMPTSVVERLSTLESKFCHMQDTLDRCLCENMTLNDKLNQKFSYSAAVAKTSQTSAISIDTVPLGSHPKEASQGETQLKTVLPCKVPSSVKSHSVLSVEHSSVGLTDTEGFRKSNYELKKIRRNAKAVVGKGHFDGTFRGAPNLPKSLFVYRVNKDTDTDIIREYVAERGIDVLDLTCMSHKDSLSKSFKLTVSNED